MTSEYLTSFLILGFIGVISFGFMYLLYWIFGYLKEASRAEPLKTKPYTGGKELTGRVMVFKTMFFQFAIYFLIFDVIAFITALAAFTPNWSLFIGSQLNLKGVHVLVYLSIVLFLYIILPKHEEEVI